MIIGFHLVWTAYGWWLPNDPRGSLSHEVLIPEIAELGSHHYGRKETQPPRIELMEFYDRARNVLKHELLKFEEDDIREIAWSFAETVETQRYTCYGCAIMPDHVHLLIRKHRHHAEEMIQHFQNASRKALIHIQRRPADHPVWGGPGWKGFLDRQTDVTRTIHYIDQNPVRIGRKMQSWDFVKTYDGWLPGRHPDAKR